MKLRIEHHMPFGVGGSFNQHFCVASESLPVCNFKVVVATCNMRKSEIKKKKKKTHENTMIRYTSNIEEHCLYSIVQRYTEKDRP